MLPFLESGGLVMSASGVLLGLKEVPTLFSLRYRILRSASYSLLREIASTSVREEFNKCCAVAPGLRRMLATEERSPLRPETACSDFRSDRNTADPGKERGWSNKADIMLWLCASRLVMGRGSSSLQQR